MEKSNLKSVLESLLFVSGEPVKIGKLAKICNTAKNDIEAALLELDEEFQKEERGLSVIRKDDSVQLATNPKNSEYVNQMVSGELNADLSRSSLETLSIIAYKGPVTRSQIEAIRGVNCSYVLRGLLMRGLAERREASDIRGYIYEISFDFLKRLGISSVENLPDWENLSKDEKVEEILSIDGQEPAANEAV
jgi:segregation and condensation protein B